MAGFIASTNDFCARIANLLTEHIVSPSAEVTHEFRPLEALLKLTNAIDGAQGEARRSPMLSDQEFSLAARKVEDVAFPSVRDVDAVEMVRQFSNQANPHEGSWRNAIVAPEFDLAELLFKSYKNPQRRVRTAYRWNGVNPAAATTRGSRRSNVLDLNALREASADFRDFKDSVVSRIFASWNQIAEWLRRLDAVRWVA